MKNLKFLKKLNLKNNEEHMMFIGRWCPLHKGHIWIIEQKLKEDNKTVLILVRNTSYDEFSARQRKKLIKKWMKYCNIKGKVMIIPDIYGIYYGRGVGYNVDEVIPPNNIESISATMIRTMIKNKDNSYEQILAPGTKKYLKKILKV